MSVLWPSIPRARWVAMVRIALIGAAMGGAYGAVHDQVSYAISPEYFTKLKFVQFHWADAGWPARVFASIVGALAVGAFGLLAGWFLARAGVERVAGARGKWVMVRAFVIVLVAAALCGAAAAGLGCWSTRGGVESWERWRQELGLRDVRGFAIVAWMHAGGYVGGVVGLIGAVLWVRRARG